MRGRIDWCAGLALILWGVVGSAWAGDTRVPIAPQTLKVPFLTTAPADTGTRGGVRWEHDLRLKASLSLNEFHEWQAGGADTRTWFVGTNGIMHRRGASTTWSTRVILDYGESEIEDQGTRKNQDKIFLESVLHLVKLRKLQPFVSLSGATQFARGYNHDTDPPTAVSGWRDPLVLTQTGGVGRDLAKGLTSRLGAAVRETFTSRFTDHSDNPDTGEIERRKTEGGVESVTSLDTRLGEAVVITSRLELFVGLDGDDTVDVGWDSEVSVKAWGALGLNYRLQVRYDEDVLARVQTRQMLGVGLNVDLL